MRITYLNFAPHLLFPQFGLSGNNPQRSHTSQMLSDQSMNFILYPYFFHCLVVEPGVSFIPSICVRVFT